MNFVSLTQILDVNKTTESIIGATIEVHRHLGPGLLESVYSRGADFNIHEARRLASRPYS